MQRVVRASLLALFTVVAAATPVVARDGAVTMRDNSYSPMNVTIRVGDSVTWTNAGDLPHDASGNGWSTPLLDPFQNDTVRFTTAGTYPYQCTIHSEMRGTVRVLAAGAALPPTDAIAVAANEPQPATGALIVGLLGALAFGATVVGIGRRAARREA